MKESTCLPPAQRGGDSRGPPGHLPALLGLCMPDVELQGIAVLSLLLLYVFVPESQSLPILMV